MSAPLHKTTIEIWTDYDPRTRGGGMEIDALAEQATSGDAYCARQVTVEVPVAQVHEHGDGVDAMLGFFGIDTEDSAGAAQPDPERDPAQAVVPARFSTDDHAHEVTFDAVGYFTSASAGDLIALRDCGWGGSDAADAVAYHFEAASPAIRAAMSYLEGRNPAERNQIGFEVHVDAEAAERWIAAHHPGLLGGRCGRRQVMSNPLVSVESLRADWNDHPGLPT